ncbi:MAG: 23S rRNA pseudouridine1911/1915/1917 synthase [Planctomycetota bacterium]|jgi:23S rRNA pseudouridine1911/1915/1917 synthase
MLIEIGYPLGMALNVNTGEWTVSPEEDGERLDRFIAGLMKDWSRSKVQGFIKDGMVTVAGEKQLKPSALLTGGASIVAEFPVYAPRASRADSDRLLDVIFEDDDLLVVGKPAGLLSHRRDGGSEISLAELADAHCGPLPSPQGDNRPGIVHRLDRETSGVMVLGKTEKAMKNIMRQFKAREVKKTYGVLVTGKPRFLSDWIDEPLGRSTRHPDRISVLDEDSGGKPASTLYEVQERFNGFAFLHCTPKTGRQHQIRVHMNAVGMDVLGDRVYHVRNSTNRKLPYEAPRPHRQMLHALRLEFTHPTSKERVHFEKPLPLDFVTLLDWLRENEKAS